MHFNSLCFKQTAKSFYTKWEKQEKSSVSWLILHKSINICTHNKWNMLNKTNVMIYFQMSLSFHLVSIQSVFFAQNHPWPRFKTERWIEISDKPLLLYKLGLSAEIERVEQLHRSTDWSELQFC